MPETSGARIFISYSRKDGAEFAANLRKTLQKENFSIWQDLLALEGGRERKRRRIGRALSKSARSKSTRITSHASQTVSLPRSRERAS
jgi:hypothetical protein